MSRRAAAITTAITLFLSLFTYLAAPSQAATLTGRGLLAKITVANEVGTTKYDWRKFRPWGDLDNDCRNTRDEVLVAETALALTYVKNGTLCKVATGDWTSPYDGLRRTRTSSVSVDHRVSLKEAYQSGAHRWTTAKRERFANDMYGPTLVVVTDSVDYAKGDKDPAEWMPPLSSHHCQYALQWIQVKYRWGLTVDPAEKAALLDVLQGGCRLRQITVPTRAR